MKSVTELAEIYHANREYVGSTELKQMSLSPKHFYKAWKGDPTEATEAMETGTLLHDLLLEQNVDKYCARPLNEKGELVRSNSKEYAAFLANNVGKTPIRPELHSNLYEALTAFTENKTAMKMLSGARIEHSFYSVDHESGIKVKARPDILGDGYLVDLKTVTGTLENFERTIFNNNFDFQLCHYGEVVEEKINDYYLIGFEQKTFASKVFKIPRSYIEEAKAKRRFFLNEIAVCLHENLWPSYEQSIIEVERPKFLDNSMTLAFEGVG